MRIRCLLPILLLSALSFAQQNARVHLKSQLAQQRHLPFSAGVVVGDTLYIAGTTGLDPGAKPVSPSEEARLVMDRVKQVVEQAGMTMDDIVSFQVFCTNLANYEAFNKEYQTYFKGDYPARAFVGVDKLLFGARYEVMGIAVRRKK